MKNNSKQKVDIAVLSEKMETVEEQIKLIIENHIPHLHRRLDKLENRVAYYSGGLAVLIVVLKFLFK